MEKSFPRVLFELLAADLASDADYLRLMRLTTLAHPSQLTDLVAGRSESLRVSSEDIAEFYHSVLWPMMRLKEKAVGPSLRPPSVKHVHDEAHRVGDVSRWRLRGTPRCLRWSRP